MMSDETTSQMKTKPLASKAVIRVAIAKDVVTISKLWLKFMEYNTKFDRSFEVKHKIAGRFARELKQRLIDPNYHLVVAEVDSEIVGYCLSYISKKPYFFKLGRFGFIGDLFVLEKYRQHGIGTLLVENTHSFFRRKKVKRVELLVANKNVDTIRFWERLGYTRLLQWMYKKK
jgi:ribosomal protein S18 acetylase RimI-like enzyme